MLREADGETHAIDIHTGEQVWYNHDSRTCCVDMRYFDDHIWIADKYLCATDLQTGETVWKAKSSNDHLARWIGYDKAMIIDEDRRVFLAGQILVVQDGRIIERGTHDELLAAEGRYYELQTYQSRI